MTASIVDSCHIAVENRQAGIPNDPCMSCHTLILSDSPELATERASYTREENPSNWNRVHEYADSFPSTLFGNKKGVGCESATEESIGALAMKGSPLLDQWMFGLPSQAEQFVRPRDAVWSWAGTLDAGIKPRYRHAFHADRAGFQLDQEYKIGHEPQLTDCYSLPPLTGAQDSYVLNLIQLTDKSGRGPRSRTA
jgi:hypothetical protein